MTEERRIAEIIADCLKTGQYEDISLFLSEECRFEYPSHHLFVQGKDKIKFLLTKAKQSDNRGQFPVKLAACVGETDYDYHDNMNDHLLTVVYTHEAVFPPFHKTYIFFKLDENGTINQFTMIESARIQLTEIQNMRHE